MRNAAATILFALRMLWYVRCVWKFGFIQTVLIHGSGDVHLLVLDWSYVVSM